MLTSGFSHQVAGKVILESSVFVFGGNSARDVTLINVFRLSPRRIGESSGPERGAFNLLGHPPFFRFSRPTRREKLQVLVQLARNLEPFSLMNPGRKHFP